MAVDFPEHAVLQLPVRERIRQKLVACDTSNTAHSVKSIVGTHEQIDKTQVLTPDRTEIYRLASESRLPVSQSASATDD